MIAAILDTNVLVQAVIGSSRSASARVLDACYERTFRFIYSPETLEELIAVLMVPSIRARHGMSDDEVLEFVASLLPFARRWEGIVSVAAGITRDLTDAKFLALAEESRADYLVTNDHRHLLCLKSYGPTQIVTPAAFLRHLSE